MTWVLLVIATAILAVSMGIMVKVLLALDEIKEAAKVVATNLAIAQEAVDGVASDLVDGHKRADEANGADGPGAAADAAARSSDS